MEKVVTINLNGSAYQLDESAFALLRAYLDQADLRLKNNPDRAEIMADLEQAIAEKCRRFLSAHKNVVAAAEIDQVIKEMGPVESADDPAEAQRAKAGAAASSADANSQTTSRPGPKRLYRIREGAVFMGVCKGIAAYLNIDVSFVRVAFVLAVIATFGWGWLIYWILAFIIPEARTADERAAAHGQAPFNAQDVVDEARRAANTFRTQAATTGREWRRQAREQRRQWRQQARAWRQEWRDAVRAGRPFPPGPPGAPTMPMPPAMYAPMWPGPLMPVFGLLSFAGFVLLVLSVVSLVQTGALWGWSLPEGMPIWTGILILAVLFHVFTIPLRVARRAYRYGWGWHYAWAAAWDGVFGVVLLAFVFWMFFRHLPPTHNLHEFVQNVPDAIRGAVLEIAGWFRALADKF